MTADLQHRPTVPKWLFDAAKHEARRSPRGYSVEGVALGFAASGYVAGWQDALVAVTADRSGSATRRKRAPWPASRARY